MLTISLGKKTRRYASGESWFTRAAIRKPLALMTTFYIFGATSYCLYRFHDVPPGAVTVLMSMLSIPFAVVGSSSYEAVADKKYGREESQ